MVNREIVIPDSQGLYPYREKKHGYDFPKLFSLATRRVPLVGGSGRPVKIDLSPNKLYIQSLPRYENFLMAAVEGDNLTLNLKTKDYTTSKRHPDMFASHYIDYVMNFFMSNATQINRFTGIWQSYSVNYQEFMENMKATRNQIDAAGQTWTGRTMLRHGFTPDQITITGSYQELPRHTVLVDFTRK